MDQEHRRPRPAGINHVALEVDDIDRAIAFYGRLFDIRNVERAQGGAGRTALERARSVRPAERPVVR